MASMNVKFFFAKTKSKFDALIEKNPLALYFVTDEETGFNYLYKGDKLISAGHEATEEVAGLMSAEDKQNLKALLEKTDSSTTEITNIQQELTEKADINNVYTKEEIDNLITGLDPDETYIFSGGDI